MGNENSKPAWWIDNEAIRSELGLPSYQPPKFLDGVYTHTVINDLEERYNCSILLMGKETRYGDDWEIQVDNETVATIGRYRNENANTIYEMDARKFRETVINALIAD